MNGYYGRPKKGKMDWLTSIFFGLSVLIFIGVVVVGILISRDGGAGFRDLISGDSGNALKVQKK